MAKVFLSYSRGDRAIAELIVRSLRDSGVVTWWDEDLIAGDWSAAVDLHLSDSDCVVVVWTEGSLTDRHVLKEARRGLDSGKLVNVLAGVSRPPEPFDEAVSLAVGGWDRSAFDGGAELVENIEAIVRLADVPTPASSVVVAKDADAPEGALGEEPEIEALERARLAAAASGSAPFSTSRSIAAENLSTVARLPVLQIGGHAVASESPAAAAPPMAAPAQYPSRRSGKFPLVATASALAIATVGVATFTANRPHPSAAIVAAAPAAPAPGAAQETNEEAGTSPGAESSNGDGAGLDQSRSALTAGPGPANDAWKPAWLAGRPATWLVGLALSGGLMGGAALLARQLARRHRKQDALPSTVPPLTSQMMDTVDVSAFAPEQIQPGGSALVQIYLHKIDDKDAAAALARLADASAKSRGVTTLDLELARGTRVDVVLETDGLVVDEPALSVTWQGRPRACQFAVRAKADAPDAGHLIVARVVVGGVPVGRLTFTLGVSKTADAAKSARELRGERAKRYTQAFLSYNSYDRTEVLKRVDVLRATGMGFFQDILSIEPGEKWQPRLFEEIDRCDLFLLFWSSHAAASKWVLQEAEHALGRQRASGEGTPDIWPIILEGPPIPPPPESLQSLHFNDMLRYVVVASELENAARRP